MGYSDLHAIADLAEPRRRLAMYAATYQGLKLKGLHYVYFSKEPFVLALCRPDHRSHDWGTSYLLARKLSGEAPNTVLRAARQLKKFLDFLLTWDLDLLDVPDPFVLMCAFADYLRLLESNVRPVHAVQWAAVDRVPLNSVALAAGKVVRIGTGKDEVSSVQADWSELPSETVADTVYTAIDYYKWLQRRTVKYRDLPWQAIPHRKTKDGHGLVAATAGPRERVVPDVAVILKQVGMEASRGREVKPLNQSRLILPEQADWFESGISNEMEKFLFHLLRYFGLRAGEAANLRLDPQSVPDLMTTDPVRAKAALKDGLGGDVRWVPVGDGWWQVSVTASKTTAGIRDIPYMRCWGFPQDTFLNLLYEALFERQVLMYGRSEPDHGFLFVSRHHGHRGSPIRGESILKKFNHIAKQCWEAVRLTGGGPAFDLTVPGYSPHSFRHLFATTLIMMNAEDVSKVSLLMGHASEETTKRIYTHVITFSKNRPGNPNQTKPGTVANMMAAFRDFARQARGDAMDDD